VWIGTGNNVDIGGDIFRRTMGIRICQRARGMNHLENFTHFPLIAWVMEHRAVLVWAKLTLWQAYRKANCPSSTSPIPEFRSYETFAHTMGGLLDFVGIPAFLGNQEARRRRSDTESVQWEAFLTTVQRFFPQSFRAADIADKLKGFGSVIPDELADLNEMVERGSAVRRIGQALLKREDRPYGESALGVVRVKDGHPVVWAIRTIECTVPPKQTAEPVKHEDESSKQTDDPQA